jgi:hypothetical protein
LERPAVSRNFFRDFYLTAPGVWNAASSREAAKEGVAFCCAFWRMDGSLLALPT